MFYQIIKTLILFPFVFHDQIIGMIIFKKWNSNGVLFVEVLLNEKFSKWFFYTFKLGIEGTIVELYLFDDRGAFYVVMVRRECEVKNFYWKPLVDRLFINDKVGSQGFHLFFDACMQCCIIYCVKHISDLV